MGNGEKQMIEPELPEKDFEAAFEAAKDCGRRFACNIDLRIRLSKGSAESTWFAMSDLARDAFLEGIQWYLKHKDEAKP